MRKLFAATLSLLTAAAMLAGCSSADVAFTNSSSGEESTSADESSDSESAAESFDTAENPEYLENSGGVIKYNSETFDMYEKYFRALWLGDNGDDIDMRYSGSYARLANRRPIGYSVLGSCVCMHWIEGGAGSIYMIDRNAPDVMYYYADLGSEAVAVGDYNHIYAKGSTEEDGTLGYFGIQRLTFVDKVPSVMLSGAVLSTDDDREWLVMEKMSVVEQSDDHITLNAQCCDSSLHPFDVGYEEKIEPVMITYTIEWKGIDYSVTGVHYT